MCSTFVTFSGETYIQKKGICIGSCVAPILCDIFLSKCDRGIFQGLTSYPVARIFRYVDDYLVLMTKIPDANDINIIKNIFLGQAQGLNFTHETPTNNNLQFLDTRLTFQNDHVCWMYSPRSKKRILQYESAHSKLVKRGIVSSCLSAALKKSCIHSARESFDAQVSRLKASGYPTSILSDVVECLIKPNRTSKRSREKRSRPAVVPYIHRISHNFKRIASKYNVPVVFSAPDKLKKLCPKVNTPHKKPDKCSVRHSNQYVNCCSGVVYVIPFTCGKVYVGQSGRCINVRLREHALSLKSSPSGHLALHVRDCGCAPLLSGTTILTRSPDKRTREILEAEVIETKGDDCISAPSVTLSSKELDYMKHFP